MADVPVAVRIALAQSSPSEPSMGTESPGQEPAVCGELEDQPSSLPSALQKHQSRN